MPYRHLKPVEAKTLLDKNEGWSVLDVRTVEEFGQAHVPGAFNVPVVEPDRSGRMAPNPHFLPAIARQFSKDSRVIVHCAAGVRSMHACEILSQAGYTQVINMQAGFHGARDPTGRVVEPGWSALGFPVENAAAPEQTYAGIKKKIV